MIALKVFYPFWRTDLLRDEPPLPWKQVENKIEVAHFIICHVAVMFLEKHAVLCTADEEFNLNPDL